MPQGMMKPCACTTRTVFLAARPSPASGSAKAWPEYRFAYTYCGLGWTILRNCWYMKNRLMILPQVLRTGQWHSAAGEGGDGQRQQRQRKLPHQRTAGVDLDRDRRRARILDPSAGGLPPQHQHGHAAGVSDAVKQLTDTASSMLARSWLRLGGTRRLRRNLDFVPVPPEPRR